MDDMAVYQVVDNPELRRFEIRTGGDAPDGEPAGFAEYRLRPSSIVFTHTEVPSRYEGQGIGGTLVRAALDEARARGLKVVPLCPFVKAYIERHPEYADLVVR